MNFFHLYFDIITHIIIIILFWMADKVKKNQFIHSFAKSWDFQN